MTDIPRFQSEVDNLLAPFKGDGPGIVAAVTKDGQEIFSGAYGLANINFDVPMGRDTVIRIGSQTKQFTVLLILLLAEEGRLSLDDTIQDHLPYVPQFDYPITLWHLASNTSGMRDFLEAMMFAGLPLGAPSTRQTARDAISRQDGLNFVPGTAMLYSNTGFFLLSEVIEKIEGEPFDAVLKRRITTQLGMNDTHLMLRDSHVQKRLAAHYTRRGETWAHLGWGLELGGEGGMVSTLEDMLIWQRALSAPPAWLAGPLSRMSAPASYANGATGLYGLGLVADMYRGRHVVGHGGSVAGGKSESIRFVEDGLGIVLIANSDQAPTFSLALRIADLYFGEPSPKTNIPASLGMYREEGGSDLLAILEKNGRKVFQAGGGSSALEAVSNGTFKPERGVTDLLLTPRSDGAMDAVFCGARRIYRPLPKDGQAAQPLSGRYTNKAQGLEATITGDTREAVLHLRSGIGAFTAQIVALDADFWLLMQPEEVAMGTDKTWIATLTVTGEGFVLNSERTRSLVFAR